MHFLKAGDLTRFSVLVVTFHAGIILLLSGKDSNYFRCANKISGGKLFMEYYMVAKSVMVANKIKFWGYANGLSGSSLQNITQLFWVLTGKFSNWVDMSRLIIQIGTDCLA